MSYCNRCNEQFYNFYDLQDHKVYSRNHNPCDNCNIDFPSWIALKEHFVQSPRHFYCQWCDAHFRDDGQGDLAHMKTQHDFCSTCCKVFNNELGLHEHYRQSSQHSVPHYYCTPCKKPFHTQSNLNAHLNSATHRPKDVRCPLKGCSFSCVSNSALVLHMESGSCRSGMDRAIVNGFVRQYDTQNIITSRLLTNGDPNQHTTYLAGHASWNGRAFECYLCHGSYRSLEVLNKHLGSPRHADKAYVCPLSTCPAKFTTLSGLLQHIESQKCGVAKFRVVQNALEDIMGGMKRLAM